MNIFASHNPLLTSLWKALSGTIVTVLIVSSIGLSTPREAKAVETVIEVGSNLVQNTISAVLTKLISQATDALVIKEYALDQIAFNIARIALNQIRRSIIRWINSGFQGSPAFITDLGGFLIDAADQVAGEIIYGSELGFLCSPFQLDIRLSLSQNYRSSAAQRVQCRLSGAIGNVERFLNGDFLSGGPGSWLELTAYPNNNFFGAQANAQRLVLERVGNRITLDLNKLLWGDGFLSKTACSIIGDEENCTINMPGKAISETLTFELSTGSRALLTADEINEVISALFAQLAQQALQGAAGLLGLSATGGSYGSVSYLDRMGSPTYDPIGGEGTTDDEDGFIGSAINNENTYRGLYSGVVARANAIIVQAQSSGACTNAQSIITQTNPILNEALQKQNSADANLAKLRDMQARYATASLEAQQIILEEFMALQTSGTLHGEGEIAADRFHVDDLLGQLNGIASQLNSLCGTPGGGQIGGE